MEGSEKGKGRANAPEWGREEDGPNPLYLSLREGPRAALPCLASRSPGPPRRQQPLPSPSALFLRAFRPLPCPASDDDAGQRPRRTAAGWRPAAPATAPRSRTKSCASPTRPRTDLPGAGGQDRPRAVRRGERPGVGAWLRGELFFFCCCCFPRLSARPGHGAAGQRPILFGVLPLPLFLFACAHPRGTGPV